MLEIFGARPKARGDTRPNLHKKKHTIRHVTVTDLGRAGADKRYPPHNEWAPPHTHGWLVVVIMVIYSALVRWRGQGVV